MSLRVESWFSSFVRVCSETVVSVIRLVYGLFVLWLGPLVVILTRVVVML